MNEHIGSFDTKADILKANIQEMYLLLYSLEIGAIDFRQFLDKSLKWAKQVPDTKTQKNLPRREVGYFYVCRCFNLLFRACMAVCLSSVCI